MVLALAVRDRHLEDLAGTQRPRERRLDVVDHHVRRLAAVLQTLVAHQRARQQARFAKDLEAVARAEHEPTAREELGQRLHHRRAAGHGARAQVVAVREAAGQDDAVEVVEIPIPVPHVLDRLPDDFRDDVVEVAVAPRARKHDDAESHVGGFLLSVCRGGSWRNVVILPDLLGRGKALGPFDVDRVVFENRVGEQALTHLVHAAARLGRRRPRRRRARSACPRAGRARRRSRDRPARAGPRRPARP